MSYANPTPLRIGMTGSIAGTLYRIVGRVVLGEQEEDEVYYWNEFNLESDAGSGATLVYEETEHGPEWRLFHLFEPNRAMTAAEAAAKRAGDLIDLDGTQKFVRLLSTSRVYYIEGQAPEGVEVGDVARYFNAVSGNTMVVVSWTGEEVEFYQGVDLSAWAVSTGFKVRLTSYGRLFRTAGGGSASPKALAGVIGFLVLVIFFALNSGAFRSGRLRPAFVRAAAPASPLSVGKTGTLDGTRFQVQTHLLVEMAMVGRRFERHEYVLSDEQGNRALLVRGTRPGAGDWWLFEPLQPSTPLTQQQAAAVRWGQTVEVDGVVAKVTDLFQATLRQVESPETAELSPGDVFFGFAGLAPAGPLLVRWNAGYINFFQGQAMEDKDVLAAFGR